MTSPDAFTGYSSTTHEVKSIHRSVPETSKIITPENPQTANELNMPAIMLEELHTVIEALPAGIKDRQAVIDASNVFRGTLNIVTNPDFRSRTLIRMDGTFANDGDLKNTNDPNEAFAALANSFQGETYRQFLGNRSEVARGLIKLAQEMQKHPDDPRYAQMFTEIVNLSVNVADKDNMQSYNDQNEKSGGILEKLNVIDADKGVVVFTNEELSKIFDGSGRTRMYFSEGFVKGKHKEPGHFDIHNTPHETVAVNNFEKVIEKGWEPSRADVNKYTTDSGKWMADAYNRWYETQAKESISSVREEEKKRDAQGLQTYSSSNEFILRNTVENDAAPLLESLDKLPPELLELFVVEGKKPEDLTPDELKDVMNLLKGYGKDWNFSLENVGDGSEAKLTIEAITKWYGYDGGQIPTNTITPNVESFYPNKSELPKAISEKVRQRGEWQVGTRSSQTAGGLVLNTEQAVRTVKKGTPVNMLA